jgi:dTDP-4-amino-4,6-dideoxygalactose transaminase
VTGSGPSVSSGSDTASLGVGGAADLFSGLTRRNRAFLPELQDGMAAVIEHGQLIDGPAVASFEEAFAGMAGTTHCVGVANGLDALILSLHALGIGPGDEVIVPAQTFVASLLAVRQVGAVNVPVDVDPQTGLIRLELIDAALTPRTKAVMVVHLHGAVVDVALLRQQLEGRDDIAIIEDAAQAHGAKASDGSPVGSLGDIAAFSFYPTKNLGALGDGGCVTTSRGDLAHLVRELSRYGEAQRAGPGDQVVTSGNSRLDTLQAAFLSVFLPHLDGWNLRRIATAALYAEALGPERYGATVGASGTNVFHHFVLRTPQRDQVMQYLADAGIPTMIHYPVPAYRHPALGPVEARRLPGAEAAAAQALSLPMHPWLTSVEIEHICAALADMP